MAESSRKRCRKSKLVPRECADFVEDDVVLQDVKEPPQKKLLLEKIKKEPADYVPQPAHQFSVNVDIEVEDMDGSAPEEDPSYMKYLFSMSSDGQESKSLDYVDNNLLIEKRPVPVNEKKCAIDTNKLQMMLAQLHRTYPDEKEVVLHTRNQWGRVFADKPSEIRRTAQENQLQDVLRRWTTWTVGTNCRNRESPFSYKCYICRVAWWTYSEFRSHITRHPKCNFHLEILQQECNIVAYEITPEVSEELPVHGKCLKCAKTFKQHMTNRIPTDSYYYCIHCSDRFHTCSSLAKHESVCDRNPVKVLRFSQDGKKVIFTDYSCRICGTVFLSKTDLSEHMIICHTVRSDEPILTKIRTCRLCSLDYFNFNFHVCLKQHGNYECLYCHGKFHNKHFLELHMKMCNGIARCRICDKFLKRSCMAGEHYALHSEHFEVVHRCLVCRNIKVFMSEEAMRLHRSKYHRNVDAARRMRSERIIMSKEMLQQCLVAVAKKVKKEEAVPKMRKATSSKTVQKLTRGETMQLVRVYAPVNRKSTEGSLRRKTDNSNKESQEANTTIAHDNTVSLRGQPLTQVVIHVKKEKHDAEKEDTISDNNDITKEGNKEDNDNTEVPASLDFGNIVIKSEKLDDTDITDAVEKQIPDQSSIDSKENIVRKDNATIIEELNEFLDIKPDIIKIKEEKASDDESTEDVSSLFHITDTSTVTDDISKVFRASSTFAEEVTENSEHSKVFRVTLGLLQDEPVIKKEIKEEPDDSSLLNTSTDSKKEDSSDISERSVLNLEPEVILKAGYRKRKVYSCKKCDFSAYHREYKEHINSHCQISNNRQDNIHSILHYKCTKCNVKFPNIKKYVLHFEKYHLYHFMSCPQCMEAFDSVPKLVNHLNSHIKNQFMRLQVIGHEDGQSKKYQCKTCKEVEETRNFFEHWEKHLELCKEPHLKFKEPAAEPYKAGATGEHALKENVLKLVIAALTRDDRALGTDSRSAKTCVVCHRSFERRYDVKRHLVEHLLEDAYASIIDDMILQCQICKKLFKKPHVYKKHMRDHASLPIYQCTICDKTFSDSSNFTKHKKIHNLKAYVCDICSKKFQAKFSLEKHIEMHMNTDPITCERCDKVFYCNSFYRRHVRQLHDKPLNRFRCNLCRESFNSLKDKWDHLWLIHKQRKEKADCPVCGKSYRKFIDVKKHVQAEHNMEIRWLVSGKYIEKSKKEGTEEKREVRIKEEEDSDDDCLLIEEERETLVVYD